MQGAGRVQSGAGRIVVVQGSLFAVAPQMMAGANYRFKYNTTMPLPKQLHGEAVVQIVKSLDGDGHITSITPI
ncbi:hypothetical protein [Aeromonas allosaccharophila]|uniref:hypothetical protein n=1 Tax=Aeromonas allosaccharophila TaxID=656 RepID=UPI003D24BA38